MTARLLRSFAGLAVLQLSFMNMSASDFQSLKVLNNLERLELTCVTCHGHQVLQRISGVKGHHIISDLTQITRLDIMQDGAEKLTSRNSPPQSYDLQGLASLKKLRELTINACSMYTSVVYDAICQLPHLTALHISSPSPSLTSMPNLLELSVLSRCSSTFLPLQSLTRLSMPVSVLKQRDASKLSQLSGLSHLTLQLGGRYSQKQEVSRSLRLLAHLKSLKQLELIGLHYEIGIFEALTALTQLTEICLSLRAETFGACRLGNAPLYLSLLPNLSCLRLKLQGSTRYLDRSASNAKRFIMTEVSRQFQQHLPLVQITAGGRY